MAEDREVLLAHSWRQRAALLATIDGLSAAALTDGSGSAASSRRYRWSSSGTV